MVTYSISEAGPEPGDLRLVATTRLTPDDFAGMISELRKPALRARKTGVVAARQAAKRETIVTRWNGTETSATAEPGDWIATTLTADRKPMRDENGELNEYVIEAAKFPALYARDTGTTAHGGLYRAISEVEALYFGGGLEIIAPWGKPQQVTAGYLLNNGTDVYGNAKETFEATYAIVG